MTSASCPVCYEAYTDDDENTSARRLNCGCLICYSCISSELIENAFYCPECGAEHKGQSVEDISSTVDAVSETASKTSEEPVSDDEAITGCSNGSASRGTHLRTFSNDDALGMMSSRLSVGSNRGSVTRNPCKEPDCDKKAITNGYCLKHSKNINKSVVEVEKIANEMIEYHDLRYFSTSSRNLRRANRNSLATTNSASLREKFQSQERIEMGDALDLIMRAKAVLSREPNILRLEAPVIVVGDIHGQYFDLINILNEAKKAHTTNGPPPAYLFLGDYVDRGYYSCEVMLYLLSLKVAHPDRVWLLRGNHECASVSGHFGFKEECKMKYGVNIYYSFLLLFQTLPLGAIITTAFGDIYACHGGLSPSLNTIEDIEMIDRMVEPEGNLALMDILWADPINDENIENMTAEEYQAFLEIEWRPNPTRGCSYVYGYKSVKEFLKRNNLVCLVRAHEVQEEGYRKHFAPEIMESKIFTLKKQLDDRRKQGNVEECEADDKTNFLEENAVLEDIQELVTDISSLIRDSTSCAVAKQKANALEDAISEGTYAGTAATAPSSGSRTPESYSFGSAMDLAPSVDDQDLGGDRKTIRESIESISDNTNEIDLDETGQHLSDSAEVAESTKLVTRPSSSVISPSGAGIFVSIDQLEDFPPVITIFSAPNYCDRYQNRGAILLIDAALDQFRLIQYECVDHPKPEIVESQTTNLVELIIATCPYMPLSFRNFVRLAVELGEDVDLELEDSVDGDCINDISNVGGKEISSDETFGERREDGSKEKENGASAAAATIAALNMSKDLLREKHVGIAAVAEDFHQQTAMIMVDNDSNEIEAQLQPESHCHSDYSLDDAFKVSSEDNLFDLPSRSDKFSESADSQFGLNRASSMSSKSLISPSLAPGTTLPPRGKTSSMDAREEQQLLTEARKLIPEAASSSSENKLEQSLLQQQMVETPAAAGRTSPSLMYAKFKRRSSKTISLVRQSSVSKAMSTLDGVIPSTNTVTSSSSAAAAVMVLSSSNSSDFGDDDGDEFVSPLVRSQSASPVVHYDIADPRSPTELETNLSPRQSLGKASELHQSMMLDMNALDEMKENIECHINHPFEMKKRKSSNVYMQALASDALNEVHPEMVNDFVQRFKHAYESSVKKDFQISVFQLSHEEKPAISVRDLKKKFESKGSLSLAAAAAAASFTDGTRRRSYPPPKQIISEAGSYDGISEILHKFGGSKRPSRRRTMSPPFALLSDSLHHHQHKVHHSHSHSYSHQHHHHYHYKYNSTGHGSMTSRHSQSSLPMMSGHLASKSSGWSPTNRGDGSVASVAATAGGQTAAAATLAKHSPALHRCASDGIYVYKANSKSGGGGGEGRVVLASSAVGTAPLHPGTQPSTAEEDPRCNSSSSGSGGGTSRSRSKLSHRRPTMSPTSNAAADRRLSPQQQHQLLSVAATEAGDNSVSAAAVEVTAASAADFNGDGVMPYTASSAMRCISEELESDFNGTKLSLSTEHTPTSSRSSSPSLAASPTIVNIKHSSYDVQSAIDVPCIRSLSSSSGYNASRDISIDPSFADRDRDLGISIDAVNAAGSLDSSELETPTVQYHNHHRHHNNPRQQQQQQRTTHHRPLTGTVGLHSRSEGSMSSLQYEEEQSDNDPEPTDSVLFSQTELMGLRLMFSLFDRSGQFKITYEDLVAYAEETDDALGIRDAAVALEILDIDGDGCIGLLDFIYFARRLKKIHQTAVADCSEE